jgi:hypothetical protein
MSYQVWYSKGMKDFWLLHGSQSAADREFLPKDSILGTEFEAPSFTEAKTACLKFFEENDVFAEPPKEKRNEPRFK